MKVSSDDEDYCAIHPLQDLRVLPCQGSKKASGQPTQHFREIEIWYISEVYKLPSSMPWFLMYCAVQWKPVEIDSLSCFWSSSCYLTFRWQKFLGQPRKVTYMRWKTLFLETQATRDIAGEARGASFQYWDSCEFERMFAGVGTTRLRGLMVQSKEAPQSPCTAVVNEIDASGGRAKHRGPVDHRWIVTALNVALVNWMALCRTEKRSLWLVQLMYLSLQTKHRTDLDGSICTHAAPDLTPGRIQNYKFRVSISPARGISFPQTILCIISCLWYY